MGDRARGFELTHRIRYNAKQCQIVDYSDLMSGARDQIEWLAAESDVIYTAETPYTPALYKYAEKHEARVVLHAMPELFDEDAAAADAVWLPTMWRRDHVEHFAPGRVKIVPVPVALDRFDMHGGGPVRRVLHVSGPAMLDRAGTDLLGEALRYTTQPLTIVAVHAPRLRAAGAADVEHRKPPSDYWRLYEDVDAVVAPRRYGGLSLIAQECAGAGLPMLVLDREPDRLWPHAVTIGVTGNNVARMKGGMVPVAHARAQTLAAGLDLLARAPEQLVNDIRRLARSWAESRSWTRLAPIYLDQLAHSRTSV